MPTLSRLSLAILIELGLAATSVQAADTSTASTADVGDTLVVSAAQQNLQAPGVSTITADEIKKRPPARDVSEIIRTMPG
ncbi:MAG TPA: TonB-dependent siderophore receptor, partial [Pantoea sp.]|nr:TonB-dependent siderophore receptor [Pantoea sp.]